MRPAAILDIGSSKIVCLCGSTAVRGGTVVHGAGVCAYAGYESGEFLDIKSLDEAIVSAIRDAEEMSRIRIRDIVVAVPAPFSKLIVTAATIRLDPRKERIKADDIDELISLSLAKARAPEHVLMHSTPISYTVDGYTSSEAPEGKRAGELSAEVSHMYVQERFLNTISEILKTLSIEISMCVSTPLAESLLLIPEEERVRPAVLIDVGYTHTDVSLVENAALTNLTTIDMGGAQFASDLAYGLEIPLETAEQVKRKYTFLQEGEDKVETIRMVTGVKRVEHGVIELIVGARADEFVDLLKRSLRMLGAPGHIPYRRRFFHDARRRRVPAAETRPERQAGHALHARYEHTQLRERLRRAGLRSSRKQRGGRRARARARGSSRYFG